MGVTTLPCCSLLFSCGGGKKAWSALLFVWSHDKALLREMISPGGNWFVVWLSSLPFFPSSPIYHTVFRHTQNNIHYKFAAPWRWRGTVSLAICGAFPGQASHFLYIQCNSGSAFLLVCSQVSLPCSLQHHLSAKRMLLAARRKGREDVLWRPEGHITEPKSSKYRLFGKCLHCLDFTLLWHCPPTFWVGTGGTCCFQH